MAAHDPGVSLSTEPQQQRPASASDRAERRRLRSSQLDRICQKVSGPPGRRRRVAFVGVRVEADDGVEVDDAACLVFSDLDEPDPDERAELLARDAAEPGSAARQEGFKAAPQLTGSGVEQHRGPVVIAVAVESFTLSTMPADDAKADVVTDYSQPAEMSGTGEIVDGVVHIHAMMAVEGDKGLSGHLHQAVVDTWFVRAYVIPTTASGL